MDIITRLLRIIASFAILMMTTTLFAHGENIPGPHGGFIRMPGAFHVEVIPQKSGFEIMLLDVSFQNPTVNNSSVRTQLKYTDKTITLKCKTNENSFYCPIGKNELHNANTLEILAVRDNVSGIAAVYELPLKRK